jgi:FAD/FMN-containing dehydrogenase
LADRAALRFVRHAHLFVAASEDRVVLSRRRFASNALAAAIAASLPSGSAWSAVLSPTMRVERDVEAVTGGGAEVTLARADVQALGDGLRGNLLLPGHASYESARRVLNAQMDKRPALIVQPRGAADVKLAVDFARASNLLVAVKCGGHSPSGKSTCDDGLMIDLSLMRGVRVDPARRLARVEGGSLLGDLDHESMAFGLVTTAGTVSHTGVGGLTLGGGFGRVARRFGLALDNLRAVDIVTAGGDLLRASAEENPELYWGVRGGGGNFGVVTSFEFTLYPMQREVVGGLIVFPLEQAKSALEFYSEYAAAAPDELYLSCGLQTAPEGSGIGFPVCYSGPASRADEVLGPLRGLGRPIVDEVRAIDYVALQRSGDRDETRAIGAYTKTGFVRSISASLIDAMIAGLEGHPERSTSIGFQHAGGAIARVADDATAFPHRQILATMLLNANWASEVDPTGHIAWLRQFWATLEPHAQGFYTNDVIEESQQEIDENYLGNHARLVALKSKYDPANLFRLNANVVPGPRG